MIDFQGRSIQYLRLSVTDRCNLRCQYCMPEEGIEKLSHQDLLSLEELKTMVEELAKLGIKKVRITGGEPLVRNGISALIRDIKSVEGIQEIAMTTNGILLKPMLKSLKEAGLDRVNISLDTLKPDKYAQMTRGGDLQAVFEAIEEAKSLGMSPIKINVVLMKDFNDDEIEDFVNLTRLEPIEVRFIELMPIGEVSKWSKNQYLSNQVVLERVPSLMPIKNTNPSSPASYYRVDGALGKIGLISPMSCKFCEHCNRIRLTATGKLKTCLHTNEEVDLRPFLKEPEQMSLLASRAIFDKPKEHQLENGILLHKNMVEIGG